MKNIMSLLIKEEKIYKFVYRVSWRYGYSNDESLLLTARDPVAAVRLFNKKIGHILVDIKEFVEITPKGVDNDAE